MQICRLMAETKKFLNKHAVGWLLDFMHIAGCHGIFSILQADGRIRFIGPTAGQHEFIISVIVPLFSLHGLPSPVKTKLKGFVFESQGGCFTLELHREWKARKHRATTQGHVVQLCLGRKPNGQATAQCNFFHGLYVEGCKTISFRWSLEKTGLLAGFLPPLNLHLVVLESILPRDSFGVDVSRFETNFEFCCQARKASWSPSVN